MMNFRSVADLSELVRSSMHAIPRDIDVVIGVPRSGLLVANLISLALNLPLADVQGFADSRLLAAGKTRRHAKLEVSAENVKRALVVDDSIRTGAAMEAAIAQLSEARPDVEFIRLVAYRSNEIARSATDIALEILPEPRMFEWNAMHHTILARSCLDIDGIVCRDPTPEENDDGPAYLEFLKNADPLFVPTKPVGMFVSSRLEKYRAPTEDWLGRHGIEYGELVLLDLPNAAERRARGNHGTFKGDVYKKSSACLFIESEEPQAGEIARVSGKPVLWLPGMSLITSANARAQGHKAYKGAAKAIRRLVGNENYAVIRRLVGKDNVARRGRRP